MALIGLPGAGKSSVAPRLAARLGWSWDDLDARIERESGRGVPELLREEGEPAFRARERRALADAISGPEPSKGAGVVGLVLACGGGVVTDDGARRLLAGRATVVWLTVRPEAALARLGREGIATRPLLAGTVDAALARLIALEAARRPHYASLAAVVVATDDRSPDEVAAAAAAALRERWAGSES